MPLFRSSIQGALLLVTGLMAPPALAFELGFPVACALGGDCFIQNAFDHDPGEGAQDAACGPLAYDGHDGTDIALPTLAEQAAGVEVLAAAPGVVAGVRDGMTDAPQGREGAPDVSGRECGNGVLLRHEGGWETQYCHMAEGSVAVAEGATVEAGAVLGRIGLSGNTEFPHLHITVRRDGVEIDPFAPDATSTCGDLPAADLWAGDVALPPGGILDAGFATGVPAYEEVKDGTADRPVASAEPVVLFALMFGGRAGDVVRLSVAGPEGTVIDHEEALDRTQAQLFRAAGLRAPEGGWPAGDYRGEATLLRDGATISTRTVETTLSP